MKAETLYLLRKTFREWILREIRKLKDGAIRLRESLSNRYHSAGKLFQGIWSLRKPSLTSIVNKFERFGFRENPTIAAYVYPKWRRSVEIAARQPLLTISLIVTIYAFVAWLSTLIAPSALGLSRPSGLSDFYRDFQTVNAALLGAQATLVAVVYPLVIALVGFLFEPRTTLGGRLRVFLQETAAIPTGASALLLCAALSMQLPFASQMPVRFVGAITALNCAWFILNIIGLGWLFLANAISYIQPQSRERLIRRYIANFAWQRQLREIMAHNRLFNAVLYGYLPRGADGPENGHIHRKGNAEVAVSPFFRDMGEIGAETHLRGQQVLHDVRLPMLAVVAQAWLDRAQADNGLAPERRTEPLTPDAPRLIFMPIPGETYSGVLPLARVEHGPPLDWADRILVSLAYRFRSPPRVLTPPKTEALVKEAVTDLLALVETGRVYEFEEQLKALVELHVFLYQIAEMKDPDGSSFNYAIEAGLVPLTLGDLWAREYRDLFSRTVSRLAQEPEFFTHCAYVAGRLYSGLRDVASVDALRSVGDIGLLLYWRLRDWAAATYKAETGSTGHAGVVFQLPARLGDIYADAWRRLIAGWEQIPGQFFRRSKSGQWHWDHLRQYRVLLRTHLQNTAFMVGGSAWTGDLVGVQWSTDLLLRWFEITRRAWGDGLRVDLSWALDADFITTALLDKPWQEVLALTLSRFDQMELAPSTIFSTAIGNLWRDTQLILACLLIRWATAGGPTGAAAIAARIILRHEVYDRSFHSDNLAPFLRIEGALSAILRMVASGARLSDGYTAGISQMVAQINRITEAPYVSQRIYSSWGFHDIYELAREKAVVLAALVPDTLALPVRLPGEIARLLQLVSSDDQATRRLQDYLGSIRTALEGFDIEQDGALVAGLRKTQDAHGLDGWRNSATALIVACLDVLSAQRDERIRTATIDPNRLREIALAASKTGFDKESGAFPIGLFQEIAQTAQVLQNWTYRERHARGEFTTPLMAQLASNEESWWAKTMREYAAVVVLHDVLTSAPLEEVSGDTPEAWWSAVKAAAGVIEAAGGKPIVLVANLASPGWLNDWLWPIPGSGGAKRPADLHVERSSEDVATGYAMHLNQLPVFHAPVEKTCSYVMPTDILRRVEFTRFAPDQTVLVEFEDDQSDPWHGVLSASIARRVTLGDGKIVRVRFAAEDHGGE